MCLALEGSCQGSSFLLIAPQVLIACQRTRQRVSHFLSLRFAHSVLHRWRGGGAVLVCGHAEWWAYAMVVACLPAASSGATSTYPAAASIALSYSIYYRSTVPLHCPHLLRARAAVARLNPAPLSC